MRWIKCNRENNCYENDIPAYNKKLWEFLADELGIDENEKKQIVKYIKDTLAKPDIEISPVVFQEKEFELTEDDLTFLEQCDEIFKETILEDNDQVKFVKDYLQEERGYTEDIIRKFEIGILPPAKDIISKMVEKYSYEEETARGNIEKLLNVTKWNDSTNYEFTKNNITVAWKDENGVIKGFLLRKPTEKKNISNKYMSSKGVQKSKILFNLHNYKEDSGKKLVIVEGHFDALSATHLSSEKVQDKYHFVASGGRSVSIEQAVLLKNRGITEVILLLDNDKAGEDYKSSLKNLSERGILISVSKILTEYEVKDIDELLKNNPEEEKIMEILENAEVQELEKIKIEFDKKKEEIISQVEKEFLAQEELDTYKLQKLKIEESAFKLEESLREAISKKDISTILKVATEYNKKTYEDIINDRPYSKEEYEADMSRELLGFKTGFKELDDHVFIEPGTLTMVAGRPSHGKTTMMLNMFRNMIDVNKDNSFLFYSYEEHKQDIVNKIVLSLAKVEYLTNEMFEKMRKKHQMEGKSKFLLIENVIPQQTYWQAIKEEITQYWTAENKTNNTPISLAISKVTQWMDEGRMCVMGKKSSVEKLSFDLIDKAVEFMEENKYKPIGAVYIDYTQKLNTEEQRVNRQQEIQVICETLLNTTLNKRFHAPIILGAQVNRMVYSLATLTADKMREAGDIEQDANLILGVWDLEQSIKEQMLLLLEDYEKKKLKAKAECDEKKVKDYEDYISNVEAELDNDKEDGEETRTIKILKSRNGSRGQTDLKAYSSEFLLVDKDQIDTSNETFTLK
jgi:replicative DNA helicase